jgi:hypothetical protein
MKKIMALLTALFVLGFASGPVIAGPGPAPSSGDGISTGSGFDREDIGPNSDSGITTGPAPNSGDGVSDGSGFDEDSDALDFELELFLNS